MIRPALLLLALAAAVAALASVLMPAPGSAVRAHAVTHAAPAAATRPEVSGGTAVSSTLDADRAFFADLFDGAATDLTDAQAAWMLDTAHRMCDLGQPRADWVASLTTAGPYVLTAAEAGKLYDVAHGAFCPPPAAAVLAAPAAYRWTGHKVFRPAPPRPARVRGWSWTVTA